MVATSIGGAVGIRWRDDDLRAGEDAIGVANGGVGGEEFAPAESGAEILLGEFPEGVAEPYGHRISVC